MSKRWTVNLDPDEPCPTEASWAEFWADPPTSIDDPGLASYREWVAEVYREPGFGEDICPHCLEQARRVEILVQALEDQTAVPRPPGVTDR
jgi:hypothetical protein